MSVGQIYKKPIDLLFVEHFKRTTQPNENFNIFAWENIIQEEG